MKISKALGKKDEPQNPWSFHELEGDRWFKWSLNGSEIYLMRTGCEWRTVVKPRTWKGQVKGFGGPVPENPEVGAEFTSSVAPSRPVALRPTTLSLPYMVVTTNAIQVHRGQDAWFTLDLPVSVHFELDDGETLFTLNTILLNKTWFGDTSTGHLCFFWPAPLEPNPANAQELDHSPWGALLRCRILVRNLGKTPLKLKQFAVYTELLSIWLVKGDLRTDTILIEGLSDGSLRMGLIPDESIRSGELLFDAPMGHTELMLKKGVSFLRTITGISLEGL